MKKHLLRSSILASITSLLFIFPMFKKSELKDVAKPHLGIYECKIAKIDEVDYLDKFSYIRLELKDRNKYELTYLEKGGKEGKKTGAYRYDKKQETLTIYLDSAKLVKREFPLKKGVLSLSIAIGEKTMYAQFEQK